MVDLERYTLYRGIALLAQASLGRISANVLALGLAWEDDDPVVGLRLERDAAADRGALAEILDELDGYYHREKAIRTEVAIAPATLPARVWTYLYLRPDDVDD